MESEIKEKLEKIKEKLESFGYFVRLKEIFLFDRLRKKWVHSYAIFFVNGEHISHKRRKNLKILIEEYLPETYSIYLKSKNEENLSYPFSIGVISEVSLLYTKMRSLLIDFLVEYIEHLKSKR